MVDSVLEQFVVLFVIMNPIGIVPIFIAATASNKPAERRMIAIQAAIVAAGVLLFFIVTGQFLIEAMGISLPAFQIAGGIVLLLFGLTMIFDAPTSAAETDDAGKPGQEVSPAVFPIGVPALAGPGSRCSRSSC